MTRRVVIVLGVIIAIAAAWVLLGRDLLTFSAIKVCANNIRAYVGAHYWFSVITFSVTYCACVVCFVSTAPLALLAGYVFGMPGVGYVLLGNLIGSPCAFLLSRYVLGDWIQRYFAGYLQAFNNEIDQHGGWYLLLVRLIPVIPFVVVNALAGLTAISLRVFMASTTVGMIAPTVLFVYAGTKLAELSCVWDIFSWQMVGLLLGMLTLVLIVFQYKRAQTIKLRR